MSVNDPMLTRLKSDLEPILRMDDPREQISAYHDMPYAIFVYPPQEEFTLRKELDMLETRLSGKGKRVTRVSLADCLEEAMSSQATPEEWYEAERTQGTATVIETIHTILEQYAPLDDLVAKRLPADPDPSRDIVFISRAGALFPVYRTSSLLEQMKGKVTRQQRAFYMDKIYGARDKELGVHLLLGSVYMRREQFAKAVEEYDAVLGLDSATTAAYVERAQAYAAMGLYDQAVKDLEQYLRITDPQKDRRARVNAADLLDRYRRLSGKTPLVSTTSRRAPAAPPARAPTGPSGQAYGSPDGR